MGAAVTTFVAPSSSSSSLDVFTEEIHSRRLHRHPHHPHKGTSSAPPLIKSSDNNGNHHHHHHNNNNKMMMYSHNNDPASVLFFACKVTIVCLVFWNQFVHVRGFTSTTSTTASTTRSLETTMRRTANALPFLSSSSSTLLLAAGRGMGMGSTTTTTNNNTKKNKKNNKKTTSSSASSKSTSPFDVSASLIRLEKKYDELMKNAAKELQREDTEEQPPTTTTTSVWETPMMTSEYVIAARAAPAVTSSTTKSSIPDWVPIAQMCLKRPESEYQDGASDEMVQTAISAYCRELSHVATFGAPVFATIARNQIQYSVESVDSFHKHVYDDVIEGKAKQNQDQVMTKAEARATLGLNNSSSSSSSNSSSPETAKADIKQAYRKLSFELHPDRFQGTPEECDAATLQFTKVKLAYDTLSSGVRGQEGISWYESLGGRARTGFVGPINLLPLAAAQEHMSRHKAEGAIVGLDPTLVQSFVARHLRSE